MLGGVPKEYAFVTGDTKLAAVEAKPPKLAAGAGAGAGAGTSGGVPNV